ncbi:hypothetical protein Tco_0361883, partial [Tanacetum coccineum]
MMTTRKRVGPFLVLQLAVGHPVDLILHRGTHSLSPVCADLIPSPKRVKDSGYLADVEVDPREISLRDDAIVRVSCNTPRIQDNAAE